MATGFIARHCSAAALALAALGASAAEVSYVGAIGDKAAILVIDGAAPRTVKVGQKLGAVTVLEVERERAVVEIAGERRVLQRGQLNQVPTGASDRQSTVLAADARGHFLAEGAINGNPVRFVVDTGATVVALPAHEARRLGIDYRKGRPGTTRTAGGVVPVFRVTLDRVKVGAIELFSVDGLVIEQGLDIALLGMSFLSRVEMRNEGQTMTLIRRY
jgi:aspartyl protease family protein